MSQNGSYDSPNAGLRLLSAAISPHIRGMSANQMIGSDLLTNDKLVETGPNWQESSNDSKVGKRRLFESEKVEECRNLEQLVEMFLNRFQGKENEEFSLSELNINGVKRRIYDVMNVFEGLGLITKMEPRKKNSYIWNGMAALKLNIANIKRKATLVNQNPELITNIVNDMTETDLNETDNLADSDHSMNQSFENDKNTKNLSNLTIKFIYLFFSMRPINCALSLDEAAEKLSPNSMTSVKRRLYDITNVMLSVGLVSKVQLTFGHGINCHKKPGYQWVDLSANEKLRNFQKSTILTPEKRPNSETSRNVECQTSPSLLKSLIRDITQEINESKSMSNLCGEKTCSSTCINNSLCKNCSGRLRMRTASLNNVALGGGTARQRVLFSPLTSKGQSTPLASVKAQIQKFDRKRKSSCPVFSTQILNGKKKGKNQVTPINRFAASKNLNFASPIGREIRILPASVANNSQRIFLQPNIAASPRQPSIRMTPSAAPPTPMTPVGSDSGFGASPALQIPLSN